MASSPNSPYYYGGGGRRPVRPRLQLAMSQAYAAQQAASAGSSTDTSSTDTSSTMREDPTMRATGPSGIRYGAPITGTSGIGGVVAPPAVAVPSGVKRALQDEALRRFRLLMKSGQLKGWV